MDLDVKKEMRWKHWAAHTLAMKSGQVDIIVSPSVDMLSNLEEIPGVEVSIRETEDACLALTEDPVSVIL